MTSGGEFPSLAVVLVAAGSSRRMGFDKILAPLAGEPLIRHSARAFAESALVSEVVIVCAPGRETEIRDVLTDLPKVSAVVSGGAERQDSVWNGLEALGNRASFVAVHDAARPLVTAEMIASSLTAAQQHGAAVVAEPVTDTLQRSDAEGFCGGLVERAGLWRMQTPQVFLLPALREALAAARSAGLQLTDETSAYARSGGRVFLVENRDWNFKVTIPRDVALAEFILRERKAGNTP